MPAYLRIKEQREAIGLSLRDLADLLRPYWPTIDAPALSRMERGKRKIDAEKIPLFARALRCKPADLYDDPAPL